MFRSPSVFYCISGRVVERNLRSGCCSCPRTRARRYRSAMVMNSSSRFLHPNSYYRAKSMSSGMDDLILYCPIPVHFWSEPHCGMDGFHSKRVHYHLKRGGVRIQWILHLRYVMERSSRVSSNYRLLTANSDFHGANSFHCCCLAECCCFLRERCSDCPLEWSFRFPWGYRNHCSWDYCFGSHVAYMCHLRVDYRCYCPSGCNCHCRGGCLRRSLWADRCRYSLAFDWQVPMRAMNWYWVVGYEFHQVQYFLFRYPNCFSVYRHLRNYPGGYCYFREWCCFHGQVQPLIRFLYLRRAAERFRPIRHFYRLCR